MTEIETRREEYLPAMHSYVAPSGVPVFSCQPEPEPDPWMRHGVIGYGFYSWRNWRKAFGKDKRNARAARREARRSA